MSFGDGRAGCKIEQSIHHTTAVVTVTDSQRTNNNAFRCHTAYGHSVYPSASENGGPGRRDARGVDVRAKVRVC